MKISFSKVRTKLFLNSCLSPQELVCIAQAGLMVALVRSFGFVVVVVFGFSAYLFWFWRWGLT